uniref:Uncharacterized protein n=1 Tax=Arundo donax TaxID=35708 RepID=A0A0A9HNA0_ARUDO
MLEVCHIMMHHIGAYCIMLFGTYPSKVTY